MCKERNSQGSHNRGSETALTHTKCPCFSCCKTPKFFEKLPLSEAEKYHYFHTFFIRLSKWMEIYINYVDHKYQMSFDCNA